MVREAEAHGDRPSQFGLRPARWLLAAAVGGLALEGLEACRKQAPETPPVVLLVQRDAEGLDPHLSGQLWQTRNVLLNLYEGLVGFDRELGLVPALAESWATLDEKTWVFTLRAGVRFHTGGELQAEDVVYSLERARDHPRSSLRAALSGLRIEAQGPREVRIVTKEPDGLLVPRLREVAIASRRFAASRGEEAFQRASAGTGPYVLEAWEKGDRILLGRFEGYWGGRPAFRRALVVARAAGHPELSRLVPAGALAVSFPVPGSEEHAAALADGTARVSPGLSVVYLAFDLRAGETPGVRLPSGRRTNPFLDPRVREAIALALDLPRFRASSRAGRGHIPSQLVAPAVFGHDPTLPPARHDLGRARELLAGAPFESGVAVTLDVRTIMRSFAPPVLEALSALGWSPVLAVREDQEFFARAAKGESSLFVLRFSCRTGDAQELLDRWVATKDPALGLGTANYSYDVCPLPGLDEEIRRARRELAVPERKRLLQHALRRVTEARLALPLFVEEVVASVPKGLSWTLRADGTWLFSEAAPAAR